MILFYRKGWLREVVVESILTLIVHFKPERILSVVVPKLEPYISKDLNSITASQLMFYIGLELFARGEKQPKSVKKAILSLLPHKRMISPSTIEEISPILIEACAGFPKVSQHDSIQRID
jgi:hypothetical protein